MGEVVEDEGDEDVVVIVGGEFEGHRMQLAEVLNGLFSLDLPFVNRIRHHLDSIAAVVAIRGLHLRDRTNT